MSDLRKVVSALQDVLEEVDAGEMDAEERANVEHHCQHIHAIFGGQGPEAIYPDDGNQEVDHRDGRNDPAWGQHG